MLNFETELIGQNCASASIAYYLNIVLGFGELTSPEVSVGKPGQRTWEIWSFDGVWRVKDFNKTIFGSGDDEAVIEANLPTLVGLILEKIDYKSSVGDLTVFLSESTSLEIVGFSANQRSAWSIVGPYGRFPPSKSKEHDSNRSIEKHSKACFERWGKTLPMKNKPERCGKCAYYLHLRGAGYFWDFGMCTNDLSEYDGKVVNIGSICNQYSDTLKQEL